MAISFVLMISIWLRNLAKRFGQELLGFNTGLVHGTSGWENFSSYSVNDKNIEGFGLEITKKQIHLIVREDLQPRTIILQAWPIHHSATLPS